MRPTVLVGLRRTCRRCGVEKFATLFKKGRRLCKVCVGELQLAYHHAKKGERKQSGLTHAGKPRKACPPLVGPFEITMAECERAWGVPYRQWTRDQHLAHTALLLERQGMTLDRVAKPVQWAHGYDGIAERPWREVA